MANISFLRMNVQFIAVLSFFLSTTLFANAPEWINYTSSGRTMTVRACEGNYVWADAEDRLLRIDKTTGEVVYYDRGNSRLPNNTIKALVVDPSGTKWIATLDDSEIVKISGTEWTTYRVPDFELPRHTINALATDRDHNVWVGSTGRGLMKFDGVNWINYNTTNSGLPSNTVWSLAFDTKGCLWIGTYSGLAKFDGSNWAVYDTLNSKIPGNNVLNVGVDDKDNIWAASSRPGYVQMPPAKFDGSQWTTYAANIPAGAIGTERNGTLWFATAKGIQTSAGGSWKTYDMSNSGLPENAVSSLVFDETGAAWIGTYGGGMVRFDGMEWKKYNTLNSSLMSGWVRTVTVDPLDNYWIGADNGQIVKFDGKNWTTIDTSGSGILGDKIMALTIDSAGNVFAGTLKNGMMKYDGKQWSTMIDWSRGSIMAITIDRHGILWVGTSFGVQTFNGKVWTYYGYKTPGFPQYSNSISSIVEAPNGDIWAGSSGSPLKFSGGNWTTYTGVNVGGLAHIAIGHDGSVWLGGYASTAVGRFDGASWTYYAPQFYSYASSVSAMAVDLNGEKWVGSDYGGAAKFNGIGWKYYNVTNSGLIADNIYSLAVDSKGNKVFAAGTGISIYHIGGVVTQTPMRHGDLIPQTVTLAQNYPNPFNPATMIRYQLPASTHVTLRIYNLLGQEIATLVDGVQNAGSYEQQWDAARFASGMYICRLSANNIVQTKKMVLVR